MTRATCGPPTGYVMRVVGSSISFSYGRVSPCCIRARSARLISGRYPGIATVVMRAVRKQRAGDGDRKHDPEMVGHDRGSRYGRYAWPLAGGRRLLGGGV